MRKLHMETCIVCGRVFETSERTTCSDACIAELRHRIGVKNNPRMDRICAVCGKVFHTEKPNRTCSRECMRKLESMAKAGKYPEHLSEARKNSPNLQPNENHCLAKDWSIRSPSGTIFHFRNLPHFIRTHQHLFSQEELKPESRQGLPAAAHALGMLRPDRKNRRLSWHGWTWAG